MSIDNILDFKHEAFIISRPRRFGKSMNPQILNSYFPDKVNGIETKELFKYLKINACKFGRRTKEIHQGQYAVVLFNFKSVSGEEYKLLEYSFKVAISKAFA